MKAIIDFIMKLIKTIKRMVRIGFRRLPHNRAVTKRHIDAQIDALLNHDNDAWYALMSNPFTK